ncbi:hypothetical protein FISHEDRAFT_68421 [Fistulina hepatica ATCC 64428]|uniref:DUF6697 domain-containing protein n=1 Tax=Fistulina hepatica ATCC 64428 TaxID=1128425 RepID=A0A0D7AR99_9AGAR|nr:hypothetical protein FISHEDRAFT_68421 [Fistulina hepatica ATCC 64428]
MDTANQIEQLNSEVARLRADRNDLQKEWDVIWNDRERFRKDAAKYRAETATAHMELARFRNDFALLQNQYDEISTELCDLKRQNNRHRVSAESGSAPCKQNTTETSLLGTGPARKESPQVPFRKMPSLPRRAVAEGNAIAHPYRQEKSSASFLADAHSVSPQLQKPIEGKSGSKPNRQDSRTHLSGIPKETPPKHVEIIELLSDTDDDDAFIVELQAAADNIDNFLNGIGDAKYGTVDGNSHVIPRKRSRSPSLHFDVGTSASSSGGSEAENLIRTTKKPRAQSSAMSLTPLSSSPNASVSSRNGDIEASDSHHIRTSSDHEAILLDSPVSPFVAEPAQENKGMKSVSPISTHVTKRESQQSMPEPSKLSHEFKFKFEAIKPNSKALCLPATTVQRDISNAPVYSVQAPAVVPVSRDALSSRYGGSQATLLATMHSNVGNTVRTAIFPRPDMNPDAPTVPGEPGLLFTARTDIVEQGRLSVFRRVDIKVEGKKRTRWVYLGEYTSSTLRRLTCREFMEQSHVVRREWAASICDRAKGVYQAMNMRIARRRGKAIAEPNDVLKALCNGEEALNVIVLACVDYDHQLAEDIATHCKKDT